MNETTTTSDPGQTTDAALEDAKARSMETIAQIVRKVRQDDWLLTLTACESVRQVERKIAAADMPGIARQLTRLADLARQTLQAMESNHADVAIIISTLAHNLEATRRERDAFLPG
jgi:hypothetical protein